MVHSIAHVPSRAWHHAHVLRHQRSWLIMAGIIGSVLLLWFMGVFESVEWPALLYAVMLTVFRLTIAYVIALLIGVTIALLVGWSPFFDILFPLFDVLQNIPSFALLPIFIFFLGYTDKMIVLFAVTSIVWPILFAILTAIKNAHTDLNDAATIFGASGVKRVTSYLAPLSFPAILTGSIVGIAIGWEAIIGAEIITRVVGFGEFIITSSAGGMSGAMVAGTFFILIIVFALNRLVWAPLIAESARHYS